VAVHARSIERQEEVVRKTKVVPAVALAAMLGTLPLFAAPKPNVVLIMTDDQGYGDLSCHGNPVLKTPNLDQLCRESVRLTDFHVSPFCTPTRAALMTGRYPARTGAYRTSSGRTMLHTDERTIANVFADAGYVTGMVGKWHLGDNAPHRPQDRGFQDVVWHRCGGIGQASDYYGNDYFDDTYERNGKYEKFKGYCTDVWFAEAMRFAEENREKPFFLYLATNAPHGPYRVAPEWTDPYKDTVTWKSGSAVEPDDYKGFNAGMRGVKSTVYEGGHRVPFFVHWSSGNLKGGRDASNLSAHVDVLPTLADLCAIDLPDSLELDGRSFAAQLTDPNAPPHRDHYIAQLHGGARFVHKEQPWDTSCVVKERWRLIDGQELYNLDQDPLQSRDISAAYPNKVAELRTLYERFWESVSPRMTPVSIDLGNPAQNPTLLCSQDWYLPNGNPPWNFGAINKLVRVTGPWHVDVKKAGRYRVSLRQFPPEANRNVVAVRAKVRIADRETESKVKPGVQSVDFELDLPAGKTKLETWLFDEQGDAGGAYFTEVELLSSADEVSAYR
jgi:arylsulfatase A-like enzyme